MFKYLFLVFILIGCSNTDTLKVSKKSETKEEKYLLLKGANLYSSGKKSEALLVYEEILKINSKNIVALREKAIVEGQLGNIDKAEKNLLQVLALYPKDNLALKNLAYLNFNKKKYKKSLEYLEQIPLDFRVDQDYFMLGYINFLNKKYKISINYYENIENESIFDNILFFESYLKNLEKVEKLKIESFLTIENKVKNSKSNTLKLSNFYMTSLKRDDLSERVLKNYLTNNNIDKEVINALIKLYYKNGDKEKVKKASNLISK
ncbi:MAG: tetratricopeptide repeat protein [Cetobacterium sp.]|uniref:tetratricopeptide repeat protein n=1 Tax=Cetobacterium sp. TaxID=2071632 RepID=UPI003F2F5E2E